MRSLILCIAHIAFRALTNISHCMFHTQFKWGAILTQHMCFCVFEQKNELLRQRCLLFPEIGINTMRSCICVLVFRALQLRAYQYACGASIASTRFGIKCLFFTSFTTNQRIWCRLWHRRLFSGNSHMFVLCGFIVWTCIFDTLKVGPFYQNGSQRFRFSWKSPETIHCRKSRLGILSKISYHLFQYDVTIFCGRSKLI